MPAHRERFSKMFRLIEEMPEEAFDVGVDWRWGESFGGMLDAVRSDLALNVAPLLGHSVLRMYVMGDDPRRAATADEIATMCDVLRECLEAGAVGLSTSYVDVEDDMRPVPCRFAEHAELEALSAVLAEHGRMLQVVHEFYDAGPDGQPRSSCWPSCRRATGSPPRCRRCSTPPPRPAPPIR